MQRTSETENAYRGGDWGVKYLLRGPRLDWGIILLHPGQAMGEHGHAEVEETFYFVAGTARMVVDGVAHEARAGDAFRIEAPERHDIVNAGRVEMMHTKEATLEEIFIKVTGRGLQ